MQLQIKVTATKIKLEPSVRAQMKDLSQLFLGVI